MKFDLVELTLFLSIGLVVILLVLAFFMPDKLFQFENIKTLNRYQQFEQECLAREIYTKDQCLLIWSGK